MRGPGLHLSKPRIWTADELSNIHLMDCITHFWDWRRYAAITCGITQPAIEHVCTGTRPEVIARIMEIQRSVLAKELFQAVEPYIKTSTK